MNPGPIPEQDDEGVVIHILPGKGFQGNLHDLATHRRQEEPVRPAACRMHEAVGIDPLVLDAVAGSGF